MLRRWYSYAPISVRLCKCAQLSSLLHLLLILLMTPSQEKLSR